MPIYIKNINASGNQRNGMTLNGEDHVVIEGGTFSNNGGDGIHVYSRVSLMQKIGLPEDTDPRELADLLHALHALPDAQRQLVMESSSIFQRWTARGLDAVSFGANVVTMAGASNLAELIKQLLQ